MINPYFLMSEDNNLHSRTLNDIAVEYFELGLHDLSYQIWDALYHGLQNHANDCEDLLPVLSCNMGNMLRQTGCYEEAGRILTQGLKRCFGTGCIYAMPELILQLSILWMKSGKKEAADSLYSFGRTIFCWSRAYTVNLPIEAMIERNFLLYSETKN